MDISDFGSSDVLFNVHNYDEWASGKTREEVELLAENFPGKIYGLTEKGFEDQLYGVDNVDSFIQTGEKSGNFQGFDQDIEDADYVVLVGGNFGFCHHDAYSVLDQEHDFDTEFVFPPEACFRRFESPNPDLGVHTLQEIQDGRLDIDNDQEYFVRKVAEETGFDKYDWDKCSIQRINV